MSNRPDELTQELEGLDEVAAPAPDENPSEQSVYRHDDLESQRSATKHEDDRPPQATTSESKTPMRFTQLYIFSYLIFFSMFGTLARLGISALTIYPGAPIVNTDLWANFAGSLIMGFLREDRLLFRQHWRKQLESSRRKLGVSPDDTVEEAKEKELKEMTKKSFASTRAAVPAYIGLTVGFCGSFTSFASICRDTFLVLANNLDTAVISTQNTIGMSRARPAGDSVMAILAILILEIGLSILALIFGAHLATFVARMEEKIPIWNASRIMNPLVVFLAFGCWLGAVLMSIWPVHDAWRGQALFAVVFAPIGCLLRFQLSIRMNRLVSSFPLGTFTANVFGTCVLGMCFDLKASSVGAAYISCQVLQGIIDGFCGALTTVSTWVLELDALRLKHAYIYGVCSISTAVGLITIIMGSLRWTHGFDTPSC